LADSPFHNPFGALKPLREKLERDGPPAHGDGGKPEAGSVASGGSTGAPASGGPATGDAASGKPAAPVTGKGPARAVVRMERAGRGGKDVTVVEQLGLNSSQMAAWLKDLKAALGCGGVLEDGKLVLQGDHRKRLPAILTSRGVRKVTVG
jgi:translation initiation factor 1